MTETLTPKNGGKRQGSGRPKGSRNAQRPMVEALSKLKIHSVEDLVSHYKDIKGLIQNAQRRDDPRDGAHTKNLVVMRGQVLRGLLPYAFHKQAQIVSVENKTEAKKPISIRLNLSTKEEPDESM